MELIRDRVEEIDDMRNQVWIHFNRQISGRSCLQVGDRLKERLEEPVWQQVSLQVGLQTEKQIKQLVGEER